MKTLLAVTATAAALAASAIATGVPAVWPSPAACFKATGTARVLRNTTGPGGPWAQLRRITSRRHSRSEVLSQLEIRRAARLRCRRMCRSDTLDSRLEHRVFQTEFKRSVYTVVEMGLLKWRLVQRHLHEICAGHTPGVALAPLKVSEVLVRD